MSSSPAPPGQPPRLSQRVREVLRRRHYSNRTEHAYLGWMKRFVLYHGGRHPEEMDTAEVIEFLTYLAVHRRVSAATQRQAQSALLFLYRTVLGRELEGLAASVRAHPTFRRSFATHLLEAGVDIRNVQELLTTTNPNQAVLCNFSNLDRQPPPELSSNTSRITR